ncbi:hypothetical protein [Roseovarius ramblicola]|uniref:Uncharacterized protein n=1 Tax=Roseovarius ramblicola TaxID=2022336 RepID=A0ABV5I3P1_9RHOB
MSGDGPKQVRPKKRVRQDILIARIVAFLTIAVSLAMSLVLDLEDNRAELVLSVALLLLGLSVALILILLAQIYAAIEKLSD